jgi:hypothetical protein
MMRSAADFEIPNSGANWRIVKFVRQYAATSRVRSSNGGLHGPLADTARAQPCERGYPRRLRRRDHTSHNKIF